MEQEEYKIKPLEQYAVFPLDVRESIDFRTTLRALNPKGLVSGQQLTDIIEAQGLFALEESGGHMSIYDKSKKEVARVVPLISTA
jgi:hypothetical protein